MNGGKHWRSALVAALLVTFSGLPGLSAEKAILGVDGLACPFCAYGIEKKLKKAEGVAAFDIDIDAGTIEVTIKEGAQFDEEAARRVVEEAGFTLRSFEVTDDGG